MEVFVTRIAARRNDFEPLLTRGLPLGWRGQLNLKQESNGEVNEQQFPGCHA
jgi:hypothetical protein